MRIARDAHHQALVAATLLEGHIERLSCSVTNEQSSRQVTFEESSTGESALTSTEMSDRSEPAGGDLGPPPCLTQTLNTFWEGAHPGREQKGEGPLARPAAQTSPG